MQWYALRENNEYEINELGQVRSLNTKKLRKYKLDSQGYPCVRLWSKGKVHDYRLCKLVANYFLPNEQNYSKVRHIDGNKMNYCVSNLEWTNEEVESEKVIKKVTYSEDKPLSQYDLSGNHIADYRSATEAEKETGVHASNIRRVINGQRKTAGGFVWKTRFND